MFDPSLFLETLSASLVQEMKQGTLRAEESSRLMAVGSAVK